MATLRQINSPGVQITEIDKAPYAPASTGTSVLVMGFADKGQALNNNFIAAVSDFEGSFGKPTNEAERYTTAAITDLIGEGAIVNFIKVPYDNVLDTNYKAIPYDFTSPASITDNVLVCSGTLLALSAGADAITNPQTVTVCSVDTTFTNMFYTDIPALLTTLGDITCTSTVCATTLKATLAPYCQFLADTTSAVTTAGVTMTNYSAAFTQIKNYVECATPCSSTVIPAIISGFNTFYTGCGALAPSSTYFTNFTPSGVFGSEFYAGYGAELGVGPAYVRYFFEATLPIIDTQNSEYDHILNQFATLKALPIEAAAVCAINLPDAAYDVLVTENSYTTAGLDADFGVTLGTNKFMIVNENKAAISGLKVTDETDGLFVAFVDPLDAMKVQRVIYKNDNDLMDVVSQVTIGTADSDTKTYAMPLEARFASESTSQQMMYRHPIIDFTDNGTAVDLSYIKNYVTLVVGKTMADPNNEGKVQVTILESFSGSLNPRARSPITGQADFLFDKVNSSSRYIKILRNSATYTDDLFYDAGVEYSTLPFKNVTTADTTANVALFMNFLRSEAVKNITGSKLITDINTALEKVSNINELDIDIVVDAGLSTIGQFCTTTRTYDPENATDFSTILNSDGVSIWRQICTQLDGFCRLVRKDCMAVLDVPRNLVLETTQKKIRATAPANTFSNTIMPKLRFLTGLNSSYSALYADWFKMFDAASGKNIWIPQSIKAAVTCVRTDKVGNVWDAPAGLNRGTVYGVSDLSFNPKQKESDQLYPKGINYALWTSVDGYWMEGQRTTQTKPSAFDRLNVRRLFLRLERQVYKVARYFVDEPNNATTRQRFISTIDPLFFTVKTRGGMYDYLIVCDETNNTANTIDNNEMRCQILMKPVKTAEFIIVDFIAVPTGGNFSEYLN